MPDYKIDIRLIFDSGPELPIDLLSPFTIKMTRGTSPYMFTIVLRNIDQFPNPAASSNGCKATFRFYTPGEAGGRVEAEWKCYLVRAEKSQAVDGTWNVTFADERWAADYNRFTGSYNLQWPDGSYREETIQGGASGGRNTTSGGPWLAVDAFADAVTKMGYAVDVSRVPPGKRSVRLPNNLGNSDGGGWVGEVWSKVLAPMLAAIDCDLVIDNKYTWYAVPRQGDLKQQIPSLRAMKRIDDSVDAVSNGWEKPRKLRVLFEIMAEGVIESEVGGATTSGSSAIFDVPDNVMPRFSPADFDPQAWWQAQTGEIADTDWSPITTQMSIAGYGNNALICRNWFLPQVIPFVRKGEFDEISEGGQAPGSIGNSQAILKKLWYNAQLRDHWRQTYRIVFPTSSGEEFSTTLRALGKIRFGRLTPGGDTRSRGSVYCDWCEEVTTAVAQNSDPFATEFSRNHVFSPTRPAPFTARWVAQSGNELIYQIKPTPATRLGQEKIIPGLFNQHLTYGSWFTLSSDGYLERTELEGTLNQEFDFRIYLAGLLTREDPRGASSIYGTVEGRQLVVENELFPQGSMESMDVSLSKLTANFGYTQAEMARPLGTLATHFPTSLLNLGDLQAAVDRATVIAKEQFELKDSGGIVIAGVSPLSSGLITDGDIHEMSVIVGNPDPWSITTQYIVLPGLSSIQLEPHKRDGEKPELISNE